MMISVKQIVRILMPILLLSACNNQPPSQQSQNLVEQGSLTVHGVASKGPIRGADISIFAMDTNGNASGAALATTTTDNNGLWSVTLTPAPTTILLIQSSGGDYVDEADPEPNPNNKRTIALAATDVVEGVLFPGSNSASITLLTDALLEKSRNESGSTNIQTVLNNNRNNARSGLGFDPFTTAAANPISPSVNASNDSIEYAMYLGGIATALNSAAIILGKPVADYNMMMAMVEDLSDGRLDGQDQNGAVSVLVDGSPVNFPDTLDLNASILRFRNNNYFAYAATAVSDPIVVNEAALAQPGTNTFPIAADDIATTAVNTSVTIANVLANDIDADGDALTTSISAQPSNGSVSSPSNGVFVYSPNTGFSGSDAFGYQIDDGRGGTDTAQVVINVQQTVQNLAPVAFAGADQSVPEQSTVNLNGSAQDADGSIASYSWSQQSGPTVTLTSSTTATTSFSAPDVTSIQNVVLTLTVTDDQGLTGSDSVSIQINPVNAPPTANAGADQSVDEQSLITLAGSGTDTDGSISGYAWTQVSGSPVVLSSTSVANPTFTSPIVTAGNLDVLVFQLTVSDNAGSTAFDFTTVLVNPVLIAPTANAGTDQTLEELLPVNLDGSGSSDDGSIVSYAWAQIAGSPTITLTGANTPTPGFTGPDIANDTTFTFQLTVTDDEGGTASDTVDITLTSLNTGPTLSDDPGQVAVEDTLVQLTTLLDNDTDPESDSITFNSVTQPSNGTVVIDSGNTSVTYTPNLNFNGTDSFTYTAVDSFGAFSTNSATVTINVSGVNDDPTANTDSASVTQGFPLLLSSLTANDTDPENDTLSITGVGQPANTADGIAVNNGDGTVTFTPALAFNGSTSFTYTIVDGNGGSATGTVNVTVIADSDGDGIIDADETTNGTNPSLADSDSDGFYDGHEILVGTNPNLNTEFPVTTVISTANSNNVISANTSWTLASSPYWVQSDVTIQSGAILTIEAGVVVKFNSGMDILVNAGGTLDVLGNAPIPQHVRFTSINDDSLNGDTAGNGISTPASNNWSGVDFQANSSGSVNNLSVRYAYDCIYIENSSPNLNGIEVGDCYNYGIRTYSSSTSITSSLNGITVTDFDSNGSSTGNTAILFQAASSTTNTLDVSNLDINESASYSVWIYAQSNANITGSVDNVNITNSASYGVYLNNTSTGTVDPTLSNINLSNPDSTTIAHLYVNNTSSGTLSPQFDGTNTVIGLNGTGSAAIRVDNASPNFLDTGIWSLADVGYGMILLNASGIYNNINMDSIVTAGIQLGNASDPSVFSDILLTNATTPYELTGQTITPTISAGYDYSDVSVSKLYIRINGSLLADTVLTPDPLATGNSVWRATGSITVPAGTILTIEDGAILKFDPNLYLYVDGSLIIGDGDGLGANAVLTSLYDDSVGGDSNGDGSSTLPASGNWGYINSRTNSVIDIDNAIIRYNQYGLYQYNVAQATPLDISNTDFSNSLYYGLYLYAGTNHDITWNLDNVSFSNVASYSASYHGIYLQIYNNATFTGTWSNVTLNDVSGSGIYIEDNSSGIVDPTISGLTIGDTGTVGVHGVQLVGDATTTPTFDGSSGTNSILDGTYNLTLQGVGGTYSNLTLANATTASLYFSGTANPTSWDDNTIILNTAPSPYRLLVDLPASVGTLGTGNLGFNTVSSTVARDYVAIGGTISDLTLVANPLNTGGNGSIYRVDASMTVPAGVTLNVEDGAIVKLNSGSILYVDGSLTIGDGDGAGANAVFTSIDDDTVGEAAIGDGVPANGDWGYISARANSIIDIDNAIIRYNQYGLYQYNVAQATPLVISNTDFTNSLYHGLYLYAGAGHNIVWNLDNVNIADVASYSTGYRGIFLQINSNATFTGTWNSLTLNNVGGSGVYIEDTSTGIVDPTISGLTIGDTGTIGVHGVQLVGDATTAPIFDGSAGINNILAGQYNLTLQGVGGSYSNLNLDGATVSSLYISNDAAPASFDGASITLSNAPSPYTLVNMVIPGGVSYTAGAGLIEEYIRFIGPIAADLSISPDPLGTATGSGQADDPTVSFWYAPSTVNIATGTTLTIEASTLVKFAEGTYLQVNSGGALNINGTLGNEVFLTSYSDDAVNDPATSAAVNNDWYGLNFQTGSLGGSISYLSSWYAYYGVLFENLAADPVFNDIEIHYPLYGLYFNASTAIAPGFTNTYISQAQNTSLHLANTGNINPGFAGTNLISTTLAGSSDCIYNNSTSPNILISGWTIEGCQNGIEIRQAGTYTNNLIRNATQSGIYIDTASAITIRNNTIVNNGTYNSTLGGGIRFVDIGATSVIEENLIRHNEGDRGGAMYFDGGIVDVTVRNNLMVENRVEDNGGGVFIYDNTTLQFYNNTVAGNTASGTTKSGVGFYTSNFATNDLTLYYNIFAENQDDDSVENIFVGPLAITTEDYNLEDADSGLLAGNSQTIVDPLFTEGWYLTGGSPAIDAGDVTSSSLVLDSRYTETTSVDSGNVDLGFHYASASTAVDADNSTVITLSVMPVNFSEVVTYTVTPRDGVAAVIGAGLDVSVAAANFQANTGTVIDLGDGTYRFTYTAGTVVGNDTLTITVNGVALSTQPFINWQ